MRIETNTDMMTSMAATLKGVAIAEKLYNSASDNIFTPSMTLEYKRKLLRIGVVSLTDELLEMNATALVREALMLK